MLVGETPIEEVINLDPIVSKIDSLRQSKGVTKKHVATRCGHTPEWYSRLMRGDVRLRVDVLEKIAAALGEKPAVFFEDEIGDTETNEHNSA